MLARDEDGRPIDNVKETGVSWIFMDKWVGEYHGSTVLLVMGDQRHEEGGILSRGGGTKGIAGLVNGCGGCRLCTFLYHDRLTCLCDCGLHLNRYNLSYFHIANQFEC